MMAPAPERASPLTHRHAQHAAQMQDDHGWLVPRIYSSLEREQTAAREALALADLSHFLKISVRGPDTAAVGLELTGLDMLAQPRIVGGFGTDGRHLACRLTDDHLLLLAGATMAADIGNRLEQLRPHPPRLHHDVTSAYAGFSLSGPRTATVVQRLTMLDISVAALPAGRCAETNVAGVHALVIRPQQEADRRRAPELRIYVGWDVGEYFWETLLEIGREHGLEPIGMECYTQECGGH